MPAESPPKSRLVLWSRRAIRAPNATSDPEDIPWQHFLDAKVKGVEVIEGNADVVAYYANSICHHLGEAPR